MKCAGTIIRVAERNWGDLTWGSGLRYQYYWNRAIRTIATEKSRTTLQSVITPRSKLCAYYEIRV